MRYVLLAAIDGEPQGLRARDVAARVHARPGTVRRYLRELVQAGDLATHRVGGVGNAGRALYYTVASATTQKMRPPGVVRACVRHMGASGIVAYLSEHPAGRAAVAELGLPAVTVALVEGWRTNGVPAPIATALSTELARLSRMSSLAMAVDEAPVTAVIEPRGPLTPWRQERAVGYATAWQEAGAVMYDDSGEP